ncbi:MAG: hypothetical protein R3F38_14230 [Gammaproteobacteria bacterium]
MAFIRGKQKKNSPRRIHPPGRDSRAPVRASTAAHIGAPAKPIVHVGDKVLKGQKIAEATGT